MATFDKPTPATMKTIFPAVCLLVLLASCKSDDNSASIRIEPMEGPVPYSNLELNNSEDNFQFAIVTDRTGGHRPGVFLDGIRKLNLLRPEFVMSVGDLIEGYTEDTVELKRQWKEFRGFIDSLKAPFFYVPGNHDITNQVQEDLWYAQFGRPYYHFVYRDVLFLCLNSEDGYPGAGRGRIGDEQYEWIRKTLDENSNVRWTLVFMHQPLWAQESDPQRWPDVEALLEGRSHTVFTGHLHSYTRYVRNNSKYYVLATTGGGSRLRGTQVGEFDHVVWVTMTDQGPLLANLLLEGIWSDDVVTQEMREFFRPLINRRVVEVSALMRDGDRFANGTTRIRITNDSDVPMEVRFQIVPNEWLLPNIFERVITVAPNSVEDINLNLRGTASSFNSAKPLALSGTVTYRHETLPGVTLDFAQGIFPEKREYIRKATRAIVLDGDLGDWPDLPFEDNPMYTESDPFSHTGKKEDGSFRFGVSYDDQYLYIAAQVNDDEILVSHGNRPFNQDAFHINVDGRPEAVSAVSTTTGSALYVGHSPSPDGSPNTSLYQPDRLPEGTRAVTVTTESGYNAEIAIPLSYLNELQDGAWKTVRINADITDFDRDYRHKSLLWWKPDWRDENNYAGSGMFYKK
jgi:predicted phosphodiesterase